MKDGIYIYLRSWLENILIGKFFCYSFWTFKIPLLAELHFYFRKIYYKFTTYIVVHIWKRPNGGNAMSKRLKTLYLHGYLKYMSRINMYIEKFVDTQKTKKTNCQKYRRIAMMDVFYLEIEIKNRDVAV